MGIRRHSFEELPVNVISVVDIILARLLFFMVTSSFMHPSHWGIRLPKASQAKSGVNKDPLTVEITASGMIYIDHQRIPLRGLSKRLSRLAGNNKDHIVILEADRNTQEQYMVDVLNAAEQADLYRVSFVTAQVSASSQP